MVVAPLTSVTASEVLPVLATPTVPMTVVPTTTRSPAAKAGLAVPSAMVTPAVPAVLVIVDPALSSCIPVNAPVRVGAVAALAAEANAMGNAAAISTAPAARALTITRGIRLEVFIKNPSLVVVFMFHSLHIFKG